MLSKGPTNTKPRALYVVTVLPKVQLIDLFPFKTMYGEVIKAVNRREYNLVCRINQNSNTRK